MRRKELLEYACADLLKAVADKGGEMVRDPGAGLVVQEIMLNAAGGECGQDGQEAPLMLSVDKSGAIASLMAPLCVPYPDVAPMDSEIDPATSHLLDLSHSTRTYKLLLSGGHFDTSTGVVLVKDESLSPAFASAFWDAITSDDAGGVDNALRIAKGNAPFVVVEMVGALIAAGKGVAVKRVLGSDAVIRSVETSGKKGAELLAKTLSAL